VRETGRGPAAVVFGCAGHRLSAGEARFFADADPLGFILFARNVESPGQVADLVLALREAVGRADAPVLIDQEGGRVQRLRPPHWRRRAPGAVFGRLHGRDPEAGLRAAWLQARLMAGELAALGIDVDCHPCVDLSFPGAHDVIGDRAFSSDPAVVADLGRAACEGLLAGGVMPVIKHLPGHGRAHLDSHLALPRVEASIADLETSDFRPFRALADMPWAMTAHIVYAAVDPRAPATTSAKVVERVIRGTIAFDGLLLSDDINMHALSGDFQERTRLSLYAGCDVVLHCSGEMPEMEAVAAAARPLDEAGARRFAKGRVRLASAQAGAAGFDPEAAEAELAALLQVAVA